MIGVTRGGRNSKIHAPVDEFCRPWGIILTPGNVADCTVRPECVSLMAGVEKLLGDKAYDSDQFRRSLRQDGITPVIPSRANRKKRIRYDKEAYKGRNVIERCYCRLKDFRRIATRYDKLARNFFSSVCLVAALVYWIYELGSPSAQPPTKQGFGSTLVQVRYGTRPSDATFVRTDWCARSQSGYERRKNGIAVKRLTLRVPILNKGEPPGKWHMDEWIVAALAELYPSQAE